MASSSFLQSPARCWKVDRGNPIANGGWSGDKDNSFPGETEGRAAPGPINAKLPARGGGSAASCRSGAKSEFRKELRTESSLHGLAGSEEGGCHHLGGFPGHLGDFAGLVPFGSKADDGAVSLVEGVHRAHDVGHVLSGDDVAKTLSYDVGQPPLCI